MSDSGPDRSAESLPSSRKQFKIGGAAFLCTVLVLVGLGILRSAVTTRLDGFTIDEAYHIAAGVSYVRYHDFRINPEHPPLVKLWVGSIISATGFQLGPLRQFSWISPMSAAFTEGASVPRKRPRFGAATRPRCDVRPKLAAADFALHSRCWRDFDALRGPRAL